MDSILISVIIPVYNTAQYLKRCLDSVLSQTFQDFEVILVNDGSKDDSWKICDEYAQLDFRIIVFHKENEGVSVARNYGLQHARGIWITFVDSDDFLEPFYLEDLYKGSKGVQLVCAGHRNLGSEKLVASQHYDELYVSFAQQDGASVIFQKIRGVSCSKLYLAEIIHKYNLQFDRQIRYAEDLCFVMDYLYRIEAVRFINSCQYVYVQRSDSAIHTQERINYEELWMRYKHQSVSYFRILEKVNSNVKKKGMNVLATLLFSVVCTLYRSTKTSRGERKQFFNVLSHQDWDLWAYYSSSHIIKRLFVIVLRTRNFGLIDIVFRTLRYLPS